MNWKLIEDKSWCSLEQLFEWVREMNTVQQDIRYHAEGSVAEHTRMVLEALQQSSAYHSLSTLEKEIIWTSALLHDVEKRSTSVDEGEGRVSAKGHARKGEYTVRTILYRDCPAPFHIREQIARICQTQPKALILREKDLKQRLTWNLLCRCWTSVEKYDVPCILHTFWKEAIALGCTSIHLPLPLLRSLSAKRGFCLLRSLPPSRFLVLPSIP